MQQYFSSRRRNNRNWFRFLARVRRTNAVIGVQACENPQESRNVINTQPSTSGTSCGIQNSVVSSDSSSIVDAIGESEIKRLPELYYSDHFDDFNQDLYSNLIDDGENVGLDSSRPGEHMYETHFNLLQYSFWWNQTLISIY